MIEQSQSLAGSLQGHRILVVEDHYVIANAIAGTLFQAGAQVAGPVSRLEDARHLLLVDHAITAGFLDVNLGEEWVWPLVDFMLFRQIPMVLATSYGWDAIPPIYAHLPRCAKWANGQAVARALAAQMHRMPQSTGPFDPQ